MTLKFRTELRNARADLIESSVGTSPILRITTSADVVLASMTLPSDWMAAAAGGSKALAGTWEDTSADASGDAAKFFIYASDGTTLWIEGTVSATGGGGDLVLAQALPAIVAGQRVTVATFTLTEGNAA